MSKHSDVLHFDKFGTPIFVDGPLAELVEIESSMLTEVGGGALDFNCGSGDVFCGNLVNAGLCTNVACGNPLTNGVCIHDAVCVSV